MASFNSIQGLANSPLKNGLVGRNELGEFRQSMIYRKKMPELRR